MPEQRVHGRQQRRGGDVSGPTCSDGIQDGNETDVDCGGGTCGRCAAGKTCKAPADCLTGECAMGKCVSNTMSWVDPLTGVCGAMISTTIAKIRDAMPMGPLTVTITAHQVTPLPNFGDWSATFPKTTCVRQWLATWAARDVMTYNNWNPAVCQATDNGGTAYYFVVKDDGDGYPQVVIYPVGAMTGQYMRVYILDRPGQGTWCNLAGVDNRQGFDLETTNSNTGGVIGDTLSFTW